MKGKKEIIDLRLTLSDEDPLYDAFLNIKKASGIKNNSDVLRFIFKQLSKISFSELLTKFEDQLSDTHQNIEA